MGSANELMSPLPSRSVQGVTGTVGACACPEPRHGGLARLVCALFLAWTACLQQTPRPVVACSVAKPHAATFAERGEGARDQSRTCTAASCHRGSQEDSMLHSCGHIQRHAMSSCGHTQRHATRSCGHTQWHIVTTPALPEPLHQLQSLPSQAQWQPTCTRHHTHQIEVSIVSGCRMFARSQLASVVCAHCQVSLHSAAAHQDARSMVVPAWWRHSLDCSTPVAGLRGWSHQLCCPIAPRAAAA